MNKQHILDEIKRTATVNNGIPLGKDRFLRETGIREADWYGKFWVRWGDAVKEAGFTPNKMIGAYDEQLLLDKFIGLMRKIGHFPVRGEHRIAARFNKDLPSEYAFYRRYGSKEGVARRIVEYCKQHEGYEDVLTMCEPVLKQSQIPEEEAVTPDDFVIGYVYLIKVGRHYKIGRSNSVGRREYELAIQLPEKGETIHTIRTDDPVGIEAYWHKRFEEKRKNGEWFELTSADVSAFKRRKFFM